MKSSPNQRDFSGGISSSPKVSKVPNSVGFTLGVDHRTDPSRITINPKAEKEYTASALPMWGVSACSYDYSYCQNGDILRRDTSWSKIHSAADSVGNGIAFFPETREIIYAQNTTLGKLTDACSTTNTITDDFLGSQGGEPTNTKSLDTEEDSSQYAYRADTSSLSITGDLTYETYRKFESLPATGESMVFMSKWDKNTNLRSYKVDVTTKSAYFGDGRDGALTISTNTTEDPIDANCTGTSGEYALTVTNAHASFASVAQGDKILIMQMRGTNAGTYQENEVESYSGGVVTLTNALTFSPLHSATESVANKAQVRVLKQHTNVTVNTGITYTAKTWGGLKGGIIGWYANGTTTITGTVSAQGKGFRGGAVSGQNPYDPPGTFAFTGEGTLGTTFRVTTATNNGNGGGGGHHDGNSDNIGIGGGGGGNAFQGRVGATGQVDGGLGGFASGSADLSTMTLGGGGGGGAGGGSNPPPEAVGAEGGGIIAIYSSAHTITGSINCKGDDGNFTAGTVGGGAQSVGGAGAGGSVKLVSDTLVAGTELVTAKGGWGTDHASLSEFESGYGSVGRVAIYYLTSVTGDSTPAASKIQDDTLNTSGGYVLRLQISDDGTAIETYTQDITDILEVGAWNRWAVSWEDTTSTAKFYRAGVLLGTKTGSMTSIDDNASKFAICASFDTAAENFYDGLSDDDRLWNDVRTASELVTYSGQVLVGTEANLIYYGEFEDDLTDSQTSGNNDLTGSGSPTYSTDVPFSGVTSRIDADQGNTDDTYSSEYTLKVAVSELATDRIKFVPAKDPYKSVILSIDTVGTGNWTVSVHDALNREVGTVTIANAELATGFYEFVFDSSFRPVIGATYHIHVISSVADGKVDVKAGETTLSDGTDVFAYFTTHYQFLVSDEYHPTLSFGGFIAIGNERYVAKLEAGDIFDPHKVSLPSGFRVRCSTRWREYSVFGCWKGSSITSSEEGLLCFWDGVNDYFNFVVPVSEGGVNSMDVYQDTIILVAGYQGTILGYKGGASVQRINHIPKIARDKKVEIAPGSMTSWRTYLCFGSDLSTDSEAIHKAVYTLGSLDSTYPFSMGAEYPTSLGDQTSSSVSLGMVYSSGQNLYIGWKNGNAYGIDKISVTNDCYETGSLESLITDYGTISKERQPLVMRADFEPLTTGQSIRVKWKIDRETSWNYSPWEDTVGAITAREPIEDKGRELEVGVDLKSTSGVSPAFLGWTTQIEALEREINA